MQLDMKLPTPILIHPSSQGLFSGSEIEEFLDIQKQNLSVLDAGVAEMMLTKHTLKQAQNMRDYASVIDISLSGINVYLDEEIKKKTKLGENLTTFESLQKECEKLAGRLDHIKKNISDDLVAKRFTTTREQVDPAKVVNAVFIYPGSALAFGRIIFGEKSHIPYYAAGAASAFGLVAAFPFQLMQGFKHVGAELSKTGYEIKNSFMLYYVKETVRKNALALSVAAVLVTKRKSKLSVRPLERVKIFGAGLKR